MFDCELVGKIGSMALIRKNEHAIDYNVFSRIGAEMIPGYIWVSSGAVEIGRLDYMGRNNGKEIESTNKDEVDACYAAQGQCILMENYRKFINPLYSVRQILVEHHHFNDSEKCEFIKTLLLDCMKQNAIPIINYNDSVSNEETRRFEVLNLRKQKVQIGEYIDNDETASEIASLVKSKYLVIMTSSFGLLKNPDDNNSLIKEVSGRNVYELLDNIDELKKYCVGASREKANGMKAKLEYITKPIKNGTTVIIGHSQYSIKDLLFGNVDRTIFKVR